MGRRNRATVSTTAAARRGAAAVPATAIPTQRAALEKLLWWTALVSAVVLWLVLAEPWSRGAVYLLGDLGGYHLPMRTFYADCLARGDSPRWIPEVFCGYYLHGEGQVGQLHPLHWLAYRLLSLSSAFNLELLINYPLLIVGTYLLLVRRGLPRSAALFGGLLFGYSGFNLTHLMHVNMVAVVTHLPWLLLAIDWSLTERKPALVAGGILLVALLTGSELLLGHPQSVWLVGVIEVAYVLFLLTSTLGWWRWSALAAAKFAGVAIGCVQLWPTWQLLGTSRRETTDEAFRGVWSLHPLNLLQMVSPYLFPDRVYEHETAGAGTHELTWYAGAIVPVLVIWLVLRWRALEVSLRRLTLWGAILAAVGFVLALGRYAGPLHSLVVSLPVVGLFRCPARYGLLMFFGSAVLGAVALADMTGVVAADERPGWQRIAGLWLVPVASVVAVLVGALAVDWWGEIEPKPAWERPITGIALTLAAAALATAALRGQRWALAGLIALTAIDLGIYGVGYAQRVQPIPLAELQSRMHKFPRDPQSRITVAGKLGQSDAALLGGARLMYGYVGLVPRMRLIANPEIAQSDPELLRRLAAVRWKCVDARSIEVEGWLPRARLVTRAQVSHDLPADIRRVDPATVALIDEPLELPAAGTIAPGRVAIVEDRPGRITCETNAPAPQLLVLAESWHPGWQVNVAGSDAAIVRTFGDFLGCVVPAGRSRVEFRFDNEIERQATWVSLGGLVLAIGLAATSGLAARRDQTRALNAGATKTDLPAAGT